MPRLLLVLLVACSETQPLVAPSDISACNLDSDCGTDTTCDCDRCITRNRTIHAERCPKVCTKNLCADKDPVCVDHQCTLK